MSDKTTQLVSGLPSQWFDQNLVTEEVAEALLADRAYVAQKCTGGAKKPVFLFPSQVVKGPWLLPQDQNRLGRELGRAALMRYWALPSTPCAVLASSLFEHPKTKGVYLVTPALYPPPTQARPWTIESVSRSVSKVGPRELEVVSRDSVGVVRISDHVRQTPSWLHSSVEVWEHLIHRCLLGCGDSGLHNMLLDPNTHRAVGVDLDENRGHSDKVYTTWQDLLFKRPPARRLHPYLEESLRGQRDSIQTIVERLDQRCDDTHSMSLVHEYQLDTKGLRERLQAVKVALLSST